MEYTLEQIRRLRPFGKRTKVVFDLIGFCPTEGQAPILLTEEREILVAGGFQAGKSVLASKMFAKRFPADILRALQLEKEGRIKLPMPYWLVGNDYDATRKEFEYLKDDLASMHLLGKSSKRVDPGYIEILGRPNSQEPLAIIRTISSGDVRNIRAEAPFGIMLCEASEITLDAYQRIRERIVPLGAWLFENGLQEFLTENHSP